MTLHPIGLFRPLRAARWRRVALAAFAALVMVAPVRADLLKEAEDAAALALRFVAAIDAGDDAGAQAMYLPPPTFVGSDMWKAMNEAARQAMQPTIDKAAADHRARLAQAYAREAAKRRARGVTGAPRMDGLNADPKGTGSYLFRIESDARNPAPGPGARTTLMSVRISRDGTGKLGVQGFSTEY